ncbi:hypothetical protein [Ornithinimicrobium kibberense]|uniref:hypothetical protein n=1 Tax=Ornithinimicrobium kibberense TaxID=282060 RepID=UPI0036138C5B
MTCRHRMPRTAITASEVRNPSPASSMSSHSSGTISTCTTSEPSSAIASTTRRLSTTHLFIAISFVEKQCRGIVQR